MVANANAFATVKLPRELVDQARHDANVFHRSIGGQLEHWARIGRAVESAPGFTLDRARAAVEGRFDPAELSDEERPYYYDLLDDDLANPSADDIEAMALATAGAGAVGVNEAGQLVRLEADGTETVLDEE